MQDIYNGIESKTISLDRNQLIGADCYDDFLEEMTRSEVETIGGIIEECARQFYPDAQVTVMGSYRRGKSTCGDVDVHITLPSYDKRKIPPKALGEIADSLWRKNHIAFHLTFLNGMTTGLELEDYQRPSQHVSDSAWESFWESHGGQPTIRSSKSYRGTINYKSVGGSYMGVFYSPIVPKRRRRVDLKIYPFRERIFASLYFTGNGFFNRSMRLWARKFGYSLNDHGLFRAGTKDRVMDDNVSEEKEVFDKLQLVYKKPTERDCFDAVEPIMDSDEEDGRTILATMLEQMTQKDFNHDNEHPWVN